jgi:hypothetical protein
VERGGIGADDEAGPLEEGPKLREGERAGEEMDPAGEIRWDVEGEAFIAGDDDGEEWEMVEQGADEVLPMGLRPFLHADTRLRAECDEGGLGNQAGGLEFRGERGVSGLGDGEAESRLRDVDAEGLEEANGLDDFVLAVMVGDSGGESGIGARAIVGDDVARAAEEADEDVAEIAANIEEEIEGAAAQAEDELQRA